MPPSNRRRTLMRIWVVLAAVMFFARCAVQARPMLKTIFGDGRHSSQLTTERARAEERASPPPPKRAVTRELHTLRIATWNLEWLDVAGRGREHRSSDDYAALARYARDLDADVIAVQEVASEDALRLVFPEAAYAYHLAKPATVQHTGFVYRRTLPVTVHADVAELAQDTLRAGADLGVRVGDRELRLLAVHLKARCIKGPLSQRDEHCVKLAQQVPALEAWIDARAGERGPFAVLGDFNRILADPKDELWHELDDGQPQSLRLERTSSRTRVSCDGHRREAAIDHIVLGGTAVDWLDRASFRELLYAPAERGMTKLSDHCPISVALQVPLMIRQISREMPAWRPP